MLPVFLGALILGGVVRWSSGSGWAGGISGPLEKDSRNASTSAGRERVVPTTTGLMEATRLWVKDSTAKQMNPYHEELATWTDAEIRAALDEGLKNRDFLLDARGARALVSKLLAEWLNRDWAAASEWFLTIPDSIRSGDMASHLSYAWPTEHAAEGLAFIKANPLVFERSSAWSIAVKNIEARAVEGAGSVIALLAELREANVGLDFEVKVEFPEDFDFATLMRSPEMAELRRRHQGDLFPAAWCRRDPEACFEWVVETGSLRGLPCLVMLGSQNPEEGLHWLGRKYEALDAEDREALMLGVPMGRADIMAKLIAGIGEREVAEDLRASCAEWLFTGEVVGALEVLGGLPDPARRLQALEDFDAGEARRFSRMSPGDVEILRARLGEWNATPEQVESLVNKYQRKK